MRRMKVMALLVCCAIASNAAVVFRIDSFQSSGELSLADAFTNGVVTVEHADTPSGPWTPLLNHFSTNQQPHLHTPTGGNRAFYRALNFDLRGTPGFTNLINSYSTLSTVAGAGGATGSGINKWRPEFENAPATSAQLSRPHIAMADTNGNIFIADKDAHGIRKVTPAGIISTVAGTSVPGNGPDVQTLGTQVTLNEPNGLWVTRPGIVFVLDLQNGKIRRLDHDGTMRTLFSVPGGIASGRGLWVSDDETLAYLCSGTTVKKWTPAGGVVDFATGFQQLGMLVIDPRGNVVVADRSAHRVYRLESDGVGRTVIAGNGTTSGGGDGQLATATGLAQVRAIWFLPTGAFVVGTDSGARIWYVDTDGIIRLFLNGAAGNAHAGDGSWFYNPQEARTGPVRAITTDHQGNLLITEHDAGYIRKIDFQRHLP